MKDTVMDEQFERAKKNLKALSAWRDQAIPETAGARATNPFRNHGTGMAGDNKWWQHVSISRAVPSSIPGTQRRRQKSNRYGRDDSRIIDEFLRSYRQTKPREESRSYAADDAIKRYMPGPDETLRKWIPRLATQIPTYDNPYFDVLRSLVGKLPLDARLRDTNRNTIASLVKSMVAEGAS